MKQLWFKAKRYGYGWYPVTWQGWLVLLAYVAFIGLSANICQYGAGGLLLPYLWLVFTATFLLIYICYRTGEPASWRWGDKGKTK